MYRFLAGAMLAVTLTLPTSAAKPPSGGTSDPQLGYIHILPSGSREIRLAAENGTGSVVLLTTRNRNVMFSLSPRTQKQIVFTDGNALRLLTYAITSTGPKTVSNVEIVNFGKTAYGVMDFSPTGSEIAFLDVRDKGLYIYDVATKAIRFVATPEYDIYRVKFSHDASKLIYDESTDFNALQTRFMSVPTSGGTPTELGIAGSYGDFDIGHSDDRIVVDTPGDWDGGAINLIPAGGGTPTRLATGYAPALRCDDKAMMYGRREIIVKASTGMYRLDLVQNTTSTFSKADNYYADYFPDC